MRVFDSQRIVASVHRILTPKITKPHPQGGVPCCSGVNCKGGVVEVAVNRWVVVVRWGGGGCGVLAAQPGVTAPSSAVDVVQNKTSANNQRGGGGYPIGCRVSLTAPLAQVIRNHNQLLEVFIEQGIPEGVMCLPPRTFPRTRIWCVLLHG